MILAIRLVYTPSVRKYLSSKWIKRDVSRRIDTSLFIHFDDKYFRTEGVLDCQKGVYYYTNMQLKQIHDPTQASTNLHLVKNRSILHI